MYAIWDFFSGYDSRLQYVFWAESFSVNSSFQCLVFGLLLTTMKVSYKLPNRNTCSLLCNFHVFCIPIIHKWSLICYNINYICLDSFYFLMLIQYKMCAHDFKIMYISVTNFYILTSNFVHVFNVMWPYVIHHKYSRLFYLLLHKLYSRWLIVFSHANAKKNFFLWLLDNVNFCDKALFTIFRRYSHLIHDSTTIITRWHTTVFILHYFSSQEHHTL